MGRELADIVRADGATDIVFVVDHPEGLVDGIEVLAPHQLAGNERLVIALGSSDERRAVADRFSAMAFTTVVSSAARVSPYASVGEGSVICDFAIINNGSRVGRHFQANCFAQVSHDCVIGDFVTFAPHVSCNGWVEIGDNVFVGAGAVIRNGQREARLKIGDGAVIGMGAVVTGDVPPATVMVGNPAGVIR
jgi:sugar O-acyltransferase (sialic acid O-acetyltransferase NeuD family)